MSIVQPLLHQDHLIATVLRSDSSHHSRLHPVAHSNMKQQIWPWISLAIAFSSLVSSEAADWPQFMRNSQHTGDAFDEQMPTAMHCVAHIPLDDSVLTSPAIVAGRAYVVDQMGTAYCIDLEKRSIVWKTVAETTHEFGSNTSSPCVVDGKVFYGTVSGNLHILNCRTGHVERSVFVGWPILDAITCTSESVYFQPLNGMIYCLDLEGDTRWTWSPYQLTRDLELRNGHSPRTDGSSSAYFAGNAVAVVGDRVVTAVADELVCLHDQGASAELVWQVHEPAGSVYSMLGPAISRDWVYVPCPGKDGLGGVLRVALKDGSLEKDRDVLLNQWASMNCAAVRDQTLYFGRSAFRRDGSRFRHTLGPLDHDRLEQGPVASPAFCSGSFRTHLLVHDAAGGTARDATEG